MTIKGEKLMFEVAGRVACVTGASSGLGQAAATCLAQHGARVVGVARREDKLTGEKRVFKSFDTELAEKNNASYRNKERET